MRRMGSLPFSNWVCHAVVLALLTMVLIGDSLAIKCYECNYPTEKCSLVDCGQSFEVCYTRYLNSTSKSKSCITNGMVQDTIGGNDTCRDGVGSVEYWKRHYKQEFNRTSKDRDPGMTPEQYAEEEWAKRKEKYGQGWGPETEKGIRVCACITDGCNDDAYDVEMNGGPVPIPIKNDESGRSNGGSGNSTATTVLLADSGNLGTVIFIALALLASLRLSPDS